MTHFVGIVVADNEQELEQILAPYNENKESEPYFVACEEDDIKSMKKCYNIKSNDLNDLIEYMEDWNGYNGAIQDGKLGYMSTYNTNSKWDWYVVGGRWGGIVPNNQCKLMEIEQYFQNYGYLPAVVVTDKGWFASKDYGWWGMYSDIEEGKEKIQSLINELSDKNCYLIDFHI
jgi:hypothetical protein